MKSYTELMTEALQYVPEEIDKREGSIIFDALAPACYMLARYYQKLNELLRQTFADTASGEYLDLRALEKGIERYQATHAIRKGTFTRQGIPVDVPINSRFETIESNPVQYRVIEQIGAGECKLECEQAGTVGNHYVGKLSALSPTVADLALLSELVVPAQDRETDESLRKRYFGLTTGLAWGGNILQYHELLAMQDGVGASQVYPKWDEEFFISHPIIISTLDAEYNVPDDLFIDELQAIIQPGNGTGLVPIGHHVQIVKPTEVPITVRMRVTPSPTPAKTEEIETAIENYITQVRKQWGEHDDLFNYGLVVQRANIVSEVMALDGVMNVTMVTINNASTDLVLDQNRNIQEAPFFSSLVLV